MRATSTPGDCMEMHNDQRLSHQGKCAVIARAWPKLPLDDHAAHTADQTARPAERCLCGYAEPYAGGREPVTHATEAPGICALQHCPQRLGGGGLRPFRLPHIARSLGAFERPGPPDGLIGERRPTNDSPATAGLHRCKRGVEEPRRADCGTHRRSAVSWVVPTLSFVSVLVVAGEPRHDLLLVALGYLVEKIFSSAATQHRGSSTVVFDDNLAVLPAIPREPVGVNHRAAQMHGAFVYVARRIVTPSVARGEGRRRRVHVSCRLACGVSSDQPASVSADRIAAAIDELPGSDTRPKPSTTPPRSSSDRFWLSLALPSTCSTRISIPMIALSCDVM